MNDQDHHHHAERAIMPDAAFLQLGDGKVAYIRRIDSDDVGSLFPGAPHLAPGLKLWALLAADGTPIMLTDSREAALANAQEADLTTVSVH